MAPRKRTQSNYKSSKIKTGWIKAELGKWVKAAEKNDCDLLELDAAPPWVLNAWQEVIAILFPGGWPAADKWDAKFAGVFFGRFLGVGHLLLGQVPLGPQVEVELEKLSKQPRKPIPRQKLNAFAKDFATQFEATQGAIAQATKSAAAASYQDATDFQKGLARGFEIKPDELTTARTFRRHTRTYYTLATMWRTWVQCESLREVHGYLCQAVGEKKIGTFKTFEKLCKKIGFRLRGRGRPSRKN